MPVTDVEIETLESYLDGALKGDDAAMMAPMLGEPRYGAAIELLRGERRERRMFFAAGEPDNSEVERFVGRVHRAVGKQRMVSRFAGVLRIGSAVAACIAVSFAIGWTLRGDRVASLPTAAGIPSGVLHGASADAKGTHAVTYQVALTDERGQVTAVQDFDSLDKAREFSQDLTRWQERQEQLRNGGAMVVADRF